MSNTTQAQIQALSATLKEINSKLEPTDRTALARKCNMSYSQFREYINGNVPVTSTAMHIIRKANQYLADKAKEIEKLTSTAA